jgi:hypothetical protein
LIDVSDNEESEYEDNDNNLNDSNTIVDAETENDDNEDKEDAEESNPMYLIHNKYITSDDPKISEFLEFCINEGLFDNTFYDTQNAFSVVATKLPKTFEKLSTDGNDIKKKSFITKFKKDFGYTGDITFIYNYLDVTKKGFITWDEFIDFFLPFVQYVTV